MSEQNEAKEWRLHDEHGTVVPNEFVYEPGQQEQRKSKLRIIIETEIDITDDQEERDIKFALERNQELRFQHGGSHIKVWRNGMPEQLAQWTHLDFSNG